MEEKEQKDAVESVDTFIRRLRDLDLVIDPQAQYLAYYHKKTRQPTGYFSDLLANAITKYEANRNPQIKGTLAEICLIWINRAFSCGLIKEGEGLITKLRECQEKNAHLERENKLIATAYKELQDKHEELENWAKDMGWEP